jgi:hypothetical protein
LPLNFTTMNKCKLILAFIPILAITTKSFSQEKQLLEELPATKEEFVKSEPLVINTAEWLESTPLNQEPEKRKQLNTKFLEWLTNSPSVTVTLNAKLVSFEKKNPDLMFVFMGGWTKYSLQNGYSKDLVQCNLAGIKSAVKLYQLGNGIKRDKEMEKLIDMDTKNSLEGWVRSQLEKN